MKKTKVAFPYIIIIVVGIFLGFIISKTQRNPDPAFIKGNYAQYFSQAGTKVVMYGTQTCKFCIKTREYLRAKNVQFVDRDIHSSGLASQDFKELQGEGVPLVLIGDRQIRGFNPEEFDAALKLIE